MKQFEPGSSSEVLITSADSRIRVVDGVELVHKYKGKPQYLITSFSNISFLFLILFFYISCNYFLTFHWQNKNFKKINIKKKINNKTKQLFLAMYYLWMNDGCRFYNLTHKLVYFSR